MIPFAVKQVWFWLALTGLVQCWVTLIYFCRNVGSLWGRLYYCAFVTLLEGAFCIGMVWHMDPSRMPRPFCIAQVISFSLASFALTGLCASLALACARAVFRPRNANTSRAILAWHPRYIPLLLLFPSAACIIHTSLLVTLDAVKPSLSDDLHCDATNPIWMRLVGYSGVPMIVSIPSLVLSILTALRLHQVKHIHSTRGTHIISNGEGYTNENGHGLTNTPPVGLHGPKKRGAFSIHAILPNSINARSKTFAPTSPPLESAFDKGLDDSMLHRHPFPVVSPLTGNAYSPSIEERDAAPFTISETSLRMVYTPMQFHPHYQPQLTNYSRTLSIYDRSLRDEGGTPDSTVSSTMPVFAANSMLSPPMTATTVATTSGNNVRLTPSSEVGLAITTGDSPSPRVSTEVGHGSDESAVMGLAVTTDEPELRITPTQHLRTPSPLKNEIYGSSSPSDPHTVQEALRPHLSVSRRSTFGAELDVREGGRSPESVTHTVSSETHLNYTAPHTFPAPDNSQDQSYLVSPGTAYSAGFTSTDWEDRDLLPSSPLASGWSFQQPTTPKDIGIDLAFDLGLGYRASKDRDEDLNRKNQGTKEWQKDDDHAMSTRTVDRLVPLERLGEYNPTLAMPTAVMLERQRQNLRREMPRKPGAILENVIWRMILFQIAICLIQMVACLSSLLDIARHTITPFGTQHVALILVAWAPLCMFVHVPNIRRFRKRRR